nr:MAG: replication associated protein [Cressdnaviricota sp.]
MDLTPSARKGQIPPCFRWCFTWFEVDPKDPDLAGGGATAEELAELLRGFCKTFKFQREKCPTTGRLHWQGMFSLQHKERLATVKNLFGSSSVNLTPTRSHFASLAYTGKTESRVEGPWTEKSSFVKVISTLRPWQADLERVLLSEPDDRTIRWFVDPVGGAGKTQFCKYMAVKHGATVLNNAGTADLAHAIPAAPKIVILNLERTVEGRVNYGMLERCKDGMLFSAKYESRMKLFNSPHVVVFANFGPDRFAMSADRWCVVELGDQERD